jgi:hypothetical protein
MLGIKTASGNANGIISLNSKSVSDKYKGYSTDYDNIKKTTIPTGYPANTFNDLYNEIGTNLTTIKTQLDAIPNAVTIKLDKVIAQFTQTDIDNYNTYQNNLTETNLTNIMGLLQNYLTFVISANGKLIASVKFMIFKTILDINNKYITAANPRFLR